MRQVWLEVRLLHVMTLAKQGHCDAALSMASQLGAVVPGLYFTKDGMQAFLDSSRTEYLLGELQSGCGHAEEAKKHYERATSFASNTSQGNQAGAAADLRKVFMRPDSLLAYHLSRTALGNTDY